MHTGGIAAAATVLVLPAVLIPMLAAAAEDDECAATGLVSFEQVTVDAAGLDAEQKTNAGVIIAVGRDMGIPQRGQIIAVATAMQESSLHNLNYGDQAGPDSRGLFQQRDPWGPLAVRMDPAGASRLFYQALRNVNGWQTMPLTVAAQAVQRSAFPSAYAKWEPLATKLVTGADVGTPQVTPAGAGTVVWPVGEDAPIGAHYGQSGPHWATTHTGQDFGRGTGYPVRAAHSGTVTKATPNIYPYGIHVVIAMSRESRTTETLYAHLSSLSVKVGQQVKAGQVIGRVGATGNTTGAHLHFELIVNGAHTDPMPWLKGQAIDPGPVDGTNLDCPTDSSTELPQGIPPVDREANAAAVRFAMSQIGKPYNRAGSTGPDSYGCNGFAWRAWHEAGSKWPLMLADEQGTTGQWVTEIPRSAAQAGDLVLTWYGNGTDTSPGVRWDHVGILLDPQKGTYVNAANSRPYPAGGVKISDLDDYRGPRVGFARVHLTAGESA